MAHSSSKKVKRTSRPRHPRLSVRELAKRNIEAVAKMQEATNEQRTFGEKVADAFAKGVGSWTFIIAQTVILVIWVVLNVVGAVYHWDPYPFILLNLALSFQAAYASPIIMMSQNRQAKAFQQRHHLDLQVNLLAEHETTEILRLLRKLCESRGIPVDPSERALEEKTSPQDLIEDIKENLDEDGKGNGKKTQGG